MYSTMLYFVTFSIMSIVSANAEICPSFKAFENFDMKEFGKGRWYEIGRYPGFEVEKDAKCAMFDYITEGNELFVLVKEVIDEKPTVKKISAQLAPDAGHTAKIIYTSGDDNDVDIISIVDVEYDSYAIFYACTVDEATKTLKELAWVDSRLPTISSEARAKVDKFIDDNTFITKSKMLNVSFSSEECLQYI